MLAVVVGAILATPLVLSAQPAATPGFAPPHERFFRLEWQLEERRGAVAIAGYIYNDYLYPVRRVQLHVQAFDGSGQLTGEAFGWVLGNVPSGGRAYFEIPASVGGQAYGVTVYAFQFGPREGV